MPQSATGSGALGATALLRPMLATPGELPGDREDARWGYEFKWDGVRALGFLRSGQLMLRSRNDRDITGSYPEVQGLAGQLGGGEHVVDGELVALDSHGRPSFAALQNRIHVSAERAVRTLVETAPVTYFVFDVLVLDGRRLLDVHYAERRALLADLGLSGPSWQSPPHYEGGGREILAASVSTGLEGVLAKRLDSTYRPGQRSPHWRKVKNLRMQEIVVGGWKPGQGRRDGLLGALLMGIPEGPALRYVGNVGTGFSDEALRRLGGLLAAVGSASSPFHDVPRQQARDARWVRPELVGEVAFGEWTTDGRLRHPTWRGLRPDLSAAEVSRVGTG